MSEIKESFIGEVFKDVGSALEYCKLLTSEGGPFQGRTAEELLYVAHFCLDSGINVSDGWQRMRFEKGYLTVPNDIMKALILNTEEVLKWDEVIVDGIPDREKTSVSITVKRSGSEEKTYVYDVEKAKREGIWITEEKAKNLASLRKSPIYKFPDRYFRGILISRIRKDLFPEVYFGLSVSGDIESLHEGVTHTQNKGVIDHKLNKDLGEKVQEEITHHTDKESSGINKDDVDPNISPAEENIYNEKGDVSFKDLSVEEKIIEINAYAKEHSLKAAISKYLEPRSLEELYNTLPQKKTIKKVRDLVVAYDKGCDVLDLYVRNNYKQHCTEEVFINILNMVEELFLPVNISEKQQEEVEDIVEDMFLPVNISEKQQEEVEDINAGEEHDTGVTDTSEFKGESPDFPNKEKEAIVDFEKGEAMFSDCEDTGFDMVPFHAIKSVGENGNRKESDLVQLELFFNLLTGKKGITNEFLFEELKLNKVYDNFKEYLLMAPPSDIAKAMSLCVISK